MRTVHVVELLFYIAGLISMVQMHMDLAMYLMFAGMILGCGAHLLMPAKEK